MTETKVYLEQVTAAARRALVLALIASLLTLAATLGAGMAPAIASLAATAMLFGGYASGGFGLVARSAGDRRMGRGHALRWAYELRSPARQRRRDRAGGSGFSLLRAGR